MKWEQSLRLVELDIYWEATMPENLVEVAFEREEDRVHELGLVVLSQRTPYWVEESPDGYRLLVRESRAEAVARQLHLYRRESLHWPPVIPVVDETGTSLYHALGWGLLLILSQSISLRWPELREAGRLTAESVHNGEIYRCFTALCLHADVGHLAGNVFFGAVFLHLVARQTTGWLAWGGTLLAGTLGNYLNAMAHYPAAHASIGASTAVFGAIGILVSLPAGLMARMRAWRLYRSWAIPLVVGLVFLAWFGTGDANTDTSAHLLGFASGLPVGLLLGWISGGRRLQASTR